MKIYKARRLCSVDTLRIAVSPDAKYMFMRCMCGWTTPGCDTTSSIFDAVRSHFELPGGDNHGLRDEVHFKFWNIWNLHYNKNVPAAFDGRFRGDYGYIQS